MPLSVANGSMGVQYLCWVINEHCVEFAPFICIKKYGRQIQGRFYVNPAGDVTGPLLLGQKMANSGAEPSGPPRNKRKVVFNCFLGVKPESACFIMLSLVFFEIP